MLNNKIEPVTNTDCQTYEIYSSMNVSCISTIRCILVILLAVMFLTPSGCGRVETTGSSRPQVVSDRLNATESTHESSESGDDDYEQHVSALEKKAPDGFTIIVQKPVVVIGDESAVTVKYRAEKTIKWAVDKLKQDYFKFDPEHIIDIWLFKDDESYYKHAEQIFQDEPTTPFGYFSEEDNALIMNISTGGGTLVHEIVHPFMHANFPDCPAWFDEGLASLYEQCGEKDGHIYGYTNWRLKGLQEAIEQDVVPSFKNLTSTSDYDFYTKDRGTNYGQARYLCYYLQEQGLLVKFYHEFYAHRKEDPTGYQTLKEILNEDDMVAFKKKWEEFVLTLTFP